MIDSNVNELALFNKIKLRVPQCYKKKNKNDINQVILFVNKNFKRKYNFYFIKFTSKLPTITINSLLHNYKNHFASSYKDQVIYNSNKEYLIDFYKLKKSRYNIKNYATVLTNYLNYFIKPIYSDEYCRTIFTKYISKAAEIFYNNNIKDKNESNIVLGESSNILTDKKIQVDENPTQSSYRKIIFNENLKKYIDKNENEKSNIFYKNNNCILDTNSNNLSLINLVEDIDQKSNLKYKIKNNKDLNLDLPIVKPQKQNMQIMTCKPSTKININKIKLNRNNDKPVLDLFPKNRKKSLINKYTNDTKLSTIKLKKLKHLNSSKSTQTINLYRNNIIINSIDYKSYNIFNNKERNLSQSNIFNRNINNKYNLTFKKFENIKSINKNIKLNRNRSIECLYIEGYSPSNYISDYNNKRLENLNKDTKPLMNLKNINTFNNKFKLKFSSPNTKQNNYNEIKKNNNYILDYKDRNQNLVNDKLLKYNIVTNNKFSKIMKNNLPKTKVFNGLENSQK